jgi:N utilization substance protein B
MATYELFYMDTPRAATINEAVELAKKFGTSESASFVNGILDKVQNHDQFLRESGIS